MLSDYLWIVIAGGVSSFISAMGIGANDVGNAFASSIGSKALTVKKAVVIAGIFECVGDNCTTTMYVPECRMYQNH